MNQQAMLHRILEILNQKIEMGAGYGRMRHKRLGRGVMAGEGVHHRRRRAGVMAGEGVKHRRRRAGMMDGEGVRHKRKKAGVMAGKKTTSPWIKHVKHYAKTHGITYGEALSKASGSYRR